MINRRPSFYVASKIWHAPVWRDFKDNGANIIATWIDPKYFAPPNELDEFEAGRALDAAEAAELWKNCIKEADAADICVIFANDGDVMKGGLIEAGACLAAGGYVIQVGDCASLRAGDGSDATFQKHPRWHRAKDLGTAFKAIILDDGTLAVPL